MALAIITKTNLNSVPDNNIFETINNRSNVADPKNRGTTGKFVYRNDPWAKGQDYQSYPYIILRLPKKTKENKSIDGKHKDITWTHSITIRTIMQDGVNNTTNTAKGVLDMYAITDDLDQTFDDTTIKNTLRSYGHYNLNLITTGVDEMVDDNGRHIHITEMELEYDTRINLG